MLAVGLAIEGMPVFTLRLVLILAYLSLVSGALGFTLWTKSQKELTAFESSSINNLMLIEIALMDFIFFGRSFSAIQIVAVLVVFGSIILIQRKKIPFQKASNPPRG
jgi:drug/metabolite transporter (DMT)-like permease